MEALQIFFVNHSPDQALDTNVKSAWPLRATTPTHFESNITTLSSVFLHTAMILISTNNLHSKHKRTQVWSMSINTFWKENWSKTSFWLEKNQSKLNTENNHNSISLQKSFTASGEYMAIAYLNWWKLEVS